MTAIRKSINNVSSCTNCPFTQEEVQAIRHFRKMSDKNKAMIRRTLYLLSEEKEKIIEFKF